MLCFKAVLLLFGCSKKKFLRMYRIFQVGGMFPTHARSGRIRSPKRLELSIAWLTIFFGLLGDKMPDGTIHMPVLLRWTHVHSLYMDEVDPCYRFRGFKACITRLFPKVSDHYPFSHSYLIYLSGTLPKKPAAGPLLRMHSYGGRAFAC